MEQKNIVIKVAREHNLKNISVEIPRNKLTVISGLSGGAQASEQRGISCKAGAQRGEHQRLEFLVNVGLSYLSLDRMAGTLSGGETQRIRLATQIGSRLTGVTYIIDEPSIGLHSRDKETLEAADHLIDFPSVI